MSTYRHFQGLHTALRLCYEQASTTSWIMKSQEKICTGARTSTATWSEIDLVELGGARNNSFSQGFTENGETGVPVVTHA